MELTFYLCDDKRNEIMVLPDDVSIDMELGGGYGDCQITAEKGLIKSRYWIYSPGTEYIACFEDLKIDTNNTTEMWTGNSVRKFLEQAIIRPPSGQDYKIVSGELNTVISDLVTPLFGGAFKVSTASTGKIVTNFRFPRYCSVYDGVVKMVQSVGYKLKIEAISTESGFDIVISAGKADNLTREFGIEFSEDEADKIKIEMYRRGINHLICLGDGELKDRVVLDLYLQPDGSVGDKQYYKGFDERVEIYDYAGVESLDDLRDGGVERLLESASYTEFTLKPNENLELDIGDYITARSYDYGIVEIVEITKKIMKITDGLVEIEYKTERNGFV